MLSLSILWTDGDFVCFFVKGKLMTKIFVNRFTKEVARKMVPIALSIVIQTLDAYINEKKVGVDISAKKN